VLAAVLERAVAEHRLDHLRLGLQRAKLEQRKQARLAAPAIDLELALVILSCVVVIERGRVDHRVEELDKRVQRLLVALEVLAVLAEAALLLGASDVPRAQRLEEREADGDGGVLGNKEGEERRVGGVDEQRLRRLVEPGSDAPSYLSQGEGRGRGACVLGSGAWEGEGGEGGGLCGHSGA
jgi:hypothetical protein